MNIQVSGAAVSDSAGVPVGQKADPVKLLSESGIRGIEPKLAHAIIFHAVPIPSEGGTLRRASAGDIFEKVRRLEGLSNPEKGRVVRQIEILHDAGVLVGKRAEGNEMRYSVCTRADQFSSSELQQYMRRALEARAPQIERAHPVAAPTLPVVPTVPAATTRSHPPSRTDDSKQLAERQRVSFGRELTRALSQVDSSLGEIFFLRDRLFVAASLAFKLDSLPREMAAKPFSVYTYAQQAVHSKWWGVLGQTGSLHPKTADDLIVHYFTEDKSQARSFVSREQFTRWRTEFVRPDERKGQLNLERLSTAVGSCVSLVDRALSSGALEQGLAEQAKAGIRPLQELLRSPGTSTASAMSVRLLRLTVPPHTEVINALTELEALSRLLNVQSKISETCATFKRSAAEEVARRVSILGWADLSTQRVQNFSQVRTACASELKAIAAVCTLDAAPREGRELELWKARQEFESEFSKKPPPELYNLPVIAAMFGSTFQNEDMPMVELDPERPSSFIWYFRASAPPLKDLQIAREAAQESMSQLAAALLSAPASSEELWGLLAQFRTAALKFSANRPFPLRDEKQIAGDLQAVLDSLSEIRKRHDDKPAANLNTSSLES